MILFIPILVYMFTYEYLYRTMPNTYTYKYNYLSDINRAAKIKVLVLGTSHAFKGINPNVITQKTFIEACDGQPVYYDSKFLHHFLVDDYTLLNLKYVILAYDYYTLTTGQTINALRESSYSIYWHFKSLHNLSRFEMLKCLNPNSTIVKNFLFNKSMIKCDSLGWNSHCKDTIELGKITEKAIDAVKKHRYIGNDASVYERNKEKINLIIEDCKLHNVKLILLNTPKTKDYFSRLNNTQLKIVTNFADSLQQSNSNVIYVNWQKNKDFDLNDFNDADHLNTAGATKLGKKIDSLLIKSDNYGTESHSIVVYANH